MSNVIQWRARNIRARESYADHLFSLPCQVYSFSVYVINSNSIEFRFKYNYNSKYNRNHVKERDKKRRSLNSKQNLCSYKEQQTYLSLMITNCFPILFFSCWMKVLQSQCLHILQNIPEMWYNPITEILQWCEWPEAQKVCTFKTSITYSLLLLAAILFSSNFCLFLHYCWDKYNSVNSSAMSVMSKRRFIKRWCKCFPFFFQKWIRFFVLTIFFLKKCVLWKCVILLKNILKKWKC